MRKPSKQGMHKYPIFSFSSGFVKRPGQSRGNDYAPKYSLATQQALTYIHTYIHTNYRQQVFATHSLYLPSVLEGCSMQTVERYIQKAGSGSIKAWKVQSRDLGNVASELGGGEAMEFMIRVRAEMYLEEKKFR